MMKRNKVFFTGTLQTPISPLADFCKQMGWELTVQSLLAFKPISFEIQRPFEVVFFSSIRSYQFFMDQLTIPLQFEAACIGQQTADKIEGLGTPLSFIGKNAGDPTSVAADFKTWVGNRNVLFPIAKDSNRSVSSRFSSDKIEEIICYQTELLPHVIEPHDWYIFTSPSNVSAYLLKNKLTTNDNIISWGKSTDKILILNNLNPIISLNTSSEKELVEILKDIN